MVCLMRSWFLSAFPHIILPIATVASIPIVYIMRYQKIPHSSICNILKKSTGRIKTKKGDYLIYQGNSVFLTNNYLWLLHLRTHAFVLLLIQSESKASKWRVIG